MSHGYVTDVTYVRNFDNDLSPSRLRLVAALNGFPTPPAEDFDYCELGCGHGDTIVALAAANPRARFLGVDLVPDHVACAKRLATDGRVDNVRFLERDFADFAGEAIPDLNFVCAHGVLSWIAPEKRRALLAFAAAKLKPGGLLYVSYNAMPGWASVEPLRQLLLSPTAGLEGDSLERARAGLAFAKQMRDGGAEYFADNPSAREMLATMEAQGLPYIVHEYLHAHWVPMYFAQVAWEMAQNDLHFVGELPLHLNFRDLAIPPALAKLFENVTDRATFESLKDFALNTFLRKDIYVKGAPRRSAAATDAYFDSTAFGLLSTRPIERKVSLPHAPLRLEGAAYDALFAALAAGAATVKELAERPGLAGLGASKVRSSLLRALLADYATPMLQSTRAVETPAEHVRPRVLSDYNRSVLQRPLPSDSPLALASPVTGTGIAIDTLQAIAIRLLTEIPPEESHEWVRALVQKRVLRLDVANRAIEDEEQQTRFILEGVAEFRRIGLAKLLELKILGEL
jgi:SAM-dependent methyltransferase